jgi:hypothetical protein
MIAALKLDVPADDPAVAARWAELLALPLREEPESDEERVIFERAEAHVRAGRRGRSAEEIHRVIERMRDGAG